MRPDSSDDLLLLKMAETLPVMARVLEHQLRVLERAPYRRRRVFSLGLHIQAVHHVVDLLEAMIELEAERAAMPPAEDEQALREELRLKLARITAAEAAQTG